VREDIDREVFRKRLLERRKAIEAGHDARQKDAQPVELDQACVGRLSRMDAMQQQAMSQESVRRAELELKRITAALNRMDSGDYGYCLKCGEEIAEGRLRIDPTTPTCIDCAQRAERK
jgi:DnaK suppressor protein